MKCLFIVLLLLSITPIPASLGTDTPPEPAGQKGVVTFKTHSEPGVPPFREGLPGIEPPALPPGASEERPAAEDPAGHWGVVDEGYQLSLRLSTNRFVVGEPVIAYVILRNCTQTNLSYIRYGGIHAGFCNFNLWDWQMKEADAPHRPPALLKPTGGVFPPGTQYRTWARLDKIFDLTRPGNYSVRAVAPVPLTPLYTGKGHTTVVSGAVQFQMVAPAEEKR